MFVIESVYWSSDIGRLKNGMQIVESGRLVIGIERDLGLSTPGDRSLFCCSFSG